MMLKRIQVVMLSTNEKANIQKFGNQLRLRLNQFKAENLAYWMNLYFLSDEAIKQGDWMGYPLLKNWVPVQYLGGDLTGFEKKIIATTDKSLTKEMYSVSSGKYQEPLPQPSKSVIEKYIEKYNKGEIIEWVNVECEKVNSKNEITIKKIKDSWTREEILQDIKEAINQGLDIKQYRDKWVF